MLRGSAGVVLRLLASGPVAAWLDQEFPSVPARRADLLARTSNQGIVHIELQSTNDETMPLRMAEYALAIRRHYRLWPRQAVLYVGAAPLCMGRQLKGPEISFRYELFDVRQIEADDLLASSDWADNLLAILAHMRDDKKTVRGVLARIQRQPRNRRAELFGQLAVLSALRSLEATVQQEANQMPIELDIRENKIIGPMILEAEEKGRTEGQVSLLRGLLRKRFGPLPAWAEDRLQAKSPTGLQDLAERLLDAAALTDLL